MSRDDIIDANPIVDFVRSRGHELKPAGQNFVTNACPQTQHKRGHRPVTINTTNNLWHCNDCKRGGSVIDWVMHERGCDSAQAMRELSGNNGAPEIVATYDYTDEGGNLLFQCVRSNPKDFWQRRPDGKGGWINNLQGVRRVLYRLPEVVAASTLCVAEGEKDCDNLAKLGFVATTNPLGAGNWRDVYSEMLRGKDVIVFGDVGDNDGKGEKHTQQVIESLTGKAKSIKHVTLPDGFHDVSDYIASLPADKARDIIGKLIDDTREVEPQSLGEADGEQTDLTSLSSPRVDDYPKPPDEAAFYGLAGKIVRRILPETEADPVALLFQLLAAFGNIIGRTAYMVADGARHYCNIFGVLVGETSKGRKGTAWRNILNILQHLDEQWCNDCIAHGLSSGEGLIWAVRDLISEKKPIKQKGRHTGEYETVVTDHGVEDKRLLVIESEFANPLKVATREGNILSAIIRCAWETGNLRTMTKNSPARATDAHISFVGHITRQENRRLLTETESANGFANRICWLAVRRSKCLPEGGEAVVIADLVVRLQNAIEFAKTCGELKRDEEARDLWARVYPKLSEGKPGLLGAITARSEAQVLRFSELYALLDCSDVVRVEHLQAALALWDYSERSAAWIFENGTGNKNADKILAALKAAGQNGLTRLQITNEVFNRHATKFEIDEALRLLHSLKLAIAKLEGTATRPAERWFFEAQPCEVCEESTLGDGKAADSSHYSHPQPSKNASSVEADKHTKTLTGDELGVARL